jgi:alkylation response protein AidB-like acyl-CoA dehydrogenase
LIVDTKSPGITITPIPAVGGERFNEVFFDAVEVPVGNRIGPENGGWRLIGESLATERHVQFSPARVSQDFADLLDWLRERDLLDDPVVRHRLSDVAVQVAEVEAHALAMLERVQDGRDAVVEAAANKLAGSEAAQAVARVAGDLGVPDSVVTGSHLEFAWRQSISETIGGGTSEIMRGVIAGHGLGLPIR